MQTVTAHGATMPVIGFGTWNIAGEECARSVAEAIRIGYRHIDTAAGYRNEDRVGEGIRASGIPRDRIFLTTKVGPENLAERDFYASVENSLKQLKVDQVDLLLIHWASKVLPVADTIKPLNEAKRRGWAKHIGVSNFTIKLLTEAWAATKEPIVTNQIEYHPYLTQENLVAFMRGKDMILTAYSPLGRQVILDDPVIAGVARKHGRTSAQVVLRWDIQQKNVVPIPKSTKAANIRSNFDIFDFALDDADMKALTALGARKQRIADWPPASPEWDL
jgi:diketogulonate reductase-like aldo/keto reductase